MKESNPRSSLLSHCLKISLKLSMNILRVSSMNKCKLLTLQKAGSLVLEKKGCGMQQFWGAPFCVRFVVKSGNFCEAKSLTQKTASQVLAQSFNFLKVSLRASEP